MIGVTGFSKSKAMRLLAILRIAVIPSIFL